ncbi:MAG TPA: protein kinase, partial [Gemmatimonadaceae bacterium]|nr:protein kinase [Gemmatimonadaceae bacterium]
HRDIKPGNVIVTSQGVAKIVDFGIARIATDDVTHATATAGTVAYMSPEQTHGAPPHPRMDVWSFGVMLYEMLTGVRPFRGDRDEVVIFAIRNDEPESIDQKSARGAPAELIQIVQRCLRKNPVERYQDAGAIVTDLRKPQDARLDSGLVNQVRTVKRVMHSRWRLGPYVIAAVAMLVILSAAALWIRYDHGSPRRNGAVMQSIAVLPFDSQLNTPNNDHFSDGLADELITALGAIPGLKVAGRTSTFALYASGMDVSAIAERLGVATMLEGSVRRDEDRLRISARLVETSNNTVLWSHAYDVPTRDVFTVQEQIARSIAEALNVRLKSTANRSALVGSSTADVEAYDLYLRGRHIRTRPTKDRLEQALAYFRGAVERDPSFAAAYSALAETYVNLANFGYVTTTEGFANANIAAERALALSPRLAEAYTSHGYVLASRREFDSAETEFRRALDLNPNFALGRHYYSLLLAMLDRTDEALDQNRRAREIDPLLAPAATDYGIILCQRNDLSGAGRELSRVLALEPNFALTLYWLGAVRAAEGSNSEAKQLLEKAARASPDYPGVPGALAYVYARAGKQNAADSIVAKLQSRASDDRTRANLAFAYAALGNRDTAFALLRRIQWDVPSMIGLRADPLLRSLRSDPRYAVLVRDIVRATR